MEYRGVEYTVVRTISPKGWRWSVKRDHSDKAGTALSRERAVIRAKMFIDDLIRRRAAAAKQQMQRD